MICQSSGIRSSKWPESSHSFKFCGTFAGGRIPGLISRLAGPEVADRKPKVSKWITGSDGKQATLTFTPWSLDPYILPTRDTDPYYGHCFRKYTASWRLMLQPHKGSFQTWSLSCAFTSHSSTPSVWQPSQCGVWCYDQWSLWSSARHHTLLL